MIDNFTPGDFEKPVNSNIAKIREMITTGVVKPGEKLPPERKLAEKFGSSRAHIREAIVKLQFYGIVEVQPQSGTIVTGIGDIASKGLITDFLKVDKSDFKSLVDTRILLEKEATRLAAINRTEADIYQLRAALSAFEAQLLKSGKAIKEDLSIHLKIAESSKNNVLKSLMMIIMPNIGSTYAELKVCEEDKNQKIIDEHRLIVNSIIEGKPAEAVRAMENHLKDVKHFSNNIK